MDAVATQLQFYDPAAREYMPTFEPPNEDHARSIANGRAWRICRADRPLKPKFMPARKSPLDHSIGEVITRYLEWAQAKGLPSITAYDSRSMTWQRTYTGEVRYISADEQFSVERVEE